VHTATGSGMPISHVGQSSIYTHDRDLILKDILHVPSTSKNLSLFTNLLMTIMLSSNFTRCIFFLRIGTRRTFFFKEDVGTGFIPFLWQSGRPSLPIKMSLSPSSLP
jgi:hypothetical protein